MCWTGWLRAERGREWVGSGGWGRWRAGGRRGRSFALVVGFVDEAGAVGL